MLHRRDADDFCRRACAVPRRARDSAALGQFLAYLEAAHLIAVPAPVIDRSPLAQLHARYTAYLQHNRALSPDSATRNWFVLRRFLVERFGDASPELADWESGRARAETLATLYDELGKRLEDHYKKGGGGREEIFGRARAEAAKTGLELPEKLNNAVVAAHRTYRGEPALFDSLHAKHGADWKRTVAALMALDRRSPWAALRAAIK